MQLFVHPTYYRPLKCLSRHNVITTRQKKVIPVAFLSGKRFQDFARKKPMDTRSPIKSFEDKFRSGYDSGGGVLTDSAPLHSTNALKYYFETGNDFPLRSFRSSLLFHESRGPEVLPRKEVPHLLRHFPLHVLCQVGIRGDDPRDLDHELPFLRRQFAEVLELVHEKLF
jgi:hypothetical protein